MSSGATVVRAGYPTQEPLSEEQAEAIRSYAREVYADPSDNDVEVDDGAPVSTAGHSGYWVQAWVFVYAESLPEELFPLEEE